MDSHVLVLPPHLQPLMEWSVDCLTSVLDLDAVTMGGGSVLAARWEHRYSTDVDFFFDKQNQPVSTLNTMIVRVSQRLGDQAESAIKVYSDGIVCRTAYGSVSFFGTLRLMNSAVTRQRENLGNFLTESSSEILLKKIRGRMVNSPTYVVRDLYDIVSAYLLDRDSLSLALAELHPSERGILEFDFSEGGFRVAQDQPLLLPKFTKLLDVELLKRLAGSILIDQVNLSTQRELEALLR